LGVFVADGGWTLVEGFGQARTWIPRLWKARNFGCNALYYPLFFPSRELPVQGSWVLEIGFGTLSKPELEIVSPPLHPEFIVFWKQEINFSRSAMVSCGIHFRVMRSTFWESKTYPALWSK
jgi:hypothetical protein